MTLEWNVPVGRNAGVTLATTVYTMTVEDFGERRTVQAAELLILVGEHTLIEDGVAVGYIAGARQVEESVAVDVTDGLDSDTVTARTYESDTLVTIEPSERGKAPVQM